MILSPNEIAFVAKPHWGDKGLTGWADIEGGHYSHFEVSVAVALAESGGDPDIMGRSSTGAAIGNRDHGLWQVSNRWHQLRGDGTPGRLLVAGATWRNPAVNAKMAFDIWEESRRAGKDGWLPWHVYTSGAFKTYLPDARIACKAPWAPPKAQQYDSILEAIDAAVGKASFIEGTRHADLKTFISNEVGGATGDLEVSLKTEITDAEDSLTALIKKPHSITLTTQVQA